MDADTNGHKRTETELLLLTENQRRALPIATSSTPWRGTVTDSWTAFHGRDIQTHYRIQVSERFKGPVESTVEVIAPGGTVGDLHQNVAGSPVLNKGAEFVFFLWTSKAGDTWITGLTQGLFSLSGNGDPMANRAGNRELTLDPATGRPVKDNALSMRLSDLRSRIAAKLGPAGVQ